MSVQVAAARESLMGIAVVLSGICGGPESLIATTWPRYDVFAKQMLKIC
jgi:hypothetical protein